MITTGRLVKEFGLSRTALLYYDSIGLLKPSGRAPNHYRLYSEADQRRLEQVCTLREAGLALEEIKQVIDSTGNTLTQVLEQRLEELNTEIEKLRNQQRFIVGLLKTDRARGRIRVMNKTIWISLLGAAGFTDEDKARWHRDFERQAPEKHQQFLEFLCIPDDEIQAIRSRARQD